MRDLYQRLNLAPNASPRAIRRALSHCNNQSLKQDVETTLLVPANRRCYDAHRDELAALGRLRAELGLTHAAHWQGETAHDFTPRPPRHTGRRGQLEARLNRALHYAAGRRHHLLILIAAMLLSAAVTALVTHWLMS
ncbi:hypothetical protein [Kushneria aurantia]|uniref:J domain-containing protein n=1 Tax=Kushneria aurantia TaxID=504092 RepID=A0ABV6G6S0_9GAMM|nr:hypothetical protein [Kushneria aurantia]